MSKRVAVARWWWSTMLVVALATIVGARAADGQRVDTPPAVSLDAAARAAGDLPRLHSLLVSWHGDLILERYFNGARASQPANVKSASKSVISALVGIAIGRGLIAGVRQPIASFFPDLEASKRQITIEDLLTMRSGLAPTSNVNYGAWVQSPNWVRYVLNRQLINAPGTHMDYSTGNTHVLSAILTKVSRTSTWQFAQDVLGGPMGFTLARWPQDPQGIYFGGNDMLLTPRQLLSFGELYLNRGRANGRQIVPAEWVDASFVARTESRWSDQLYGYGWWVRELAGYSACFAWGYGGQYAFVVPDLDLVIVTTSSPAVSDLPRQHRHTIIDFVERFIVEPIAGGVQASR
ncbi:MAG TPA: serine hydrolase [Vicinamibacterales bacterium]|jgi:CubicO group peptidase (beta-lactamase class C family)|nr:serine hydrolase [Vicinamibacterales bacterium]